MSNSDNIITKIFKGSKDPADPNKKIEQNKKVSDVFNESINNKHQGCVLFEINIRKNSIKSLDINLTKPVNLDYNFKEIKKFDEFNKSLNDISDFDLEREKEENKSEFNSSVEDFSEIENEEIIIKNKKIFNNNKYDFEYEEIIEKEFEEIKKLLH